jgi:hypothetical protein
MTTKKNASYKVSTGFNRRGERFVYFATLEAASNFCSDVFALKNIILAVTAVR